MASGDDDYGDLQLDFHQNVLLDGKEHAHTIHGFEVKISASGPSSIGEVDSGSSKVKISTVTNQIWECPTHHGKIVASNSQYLAYVLKSRSGYVLRLIQQGTNGRTLLKGFVGAIVDVAFCHATSNLLACVDEGGNLYVWDLDKSKDEAKIPTEALKIIIQRSSTADNLEHRLMWSPHVPLPDEDEDEQEICNIVLTHGSDIEVLDMHEIFTTYSSGMPVPRDKLLCGCYPISGAHGNSIHDLSLSPDGTVLATVAEDGHLKFWQVNWEKEEDELPKCLHDFIPHNGSPVTRLIFCDNHLSQDPSNQYWRFLITAAKNNTEVKIWCAVSWKCLQTIRFLAPEGDGVKEPHIVLGLDLSASYLVVTDSNRKAVLVLQLFTSSSLGDASVTSVTEYLLTQPILSFTVSGCAPLPANSDQEGFSEEEDSEEESATLEKTGKGNGKFDSRRNVVLLKLHCVHTRSMQELLVRFEPPDIFGVPASTKQPEINSKVEDNSASPATVCTSTSTHDSPPATVCTNTSTPDQLKSLPADLLDMAQNSASASPFQSLPPLNTFCSPKLLTPSEFTSPVKSESGLVTSQPLLSPASIVASATASHDTSPGVVPSLPVQPLTGSLTNPPLSDTQDTLTSVSSNLNDPLPISADDDTIDSGSPNAGVNTETVLAKENTFSDENIDEKGPETASEDEVPNLEDTQKAFDNIMEFLDVDHKAEVSKIDKPTFDEFTELLSNPEKLLEQEKELQLAEEPQDQPLVEDDPSLEVSSDKSHSSFFPDVLKSTSGQDPPLHESDTEVRMSESEVSHWPDIGVPGPPAEPLQISSSQCNLPEANYVAGAVSNEMYQAGSSSGLLMPSALADLQMVEVEDNGVDVDNTPDLLDQEPSLDTKWTLEVGEGNLKPKSKPKKRSRRGKKQNTGASMSVAEVLEAPSASDGEAVQQNSAMVDLLPPGETDFILKMPVPVDMAKEDSSISQLVKLVSDQHQMLCELKSDQQKNLLALQDQIKELKLSVIEEQKAELAVVKVEQRGLEQKFDRVLKDKQALDKHKQDKLISTLSNTLTTAVNAKLDKLIKSEMKNNILPVIQQSISSLHDELSGSIASRLTATDVAMRDGINQLIASKGLPDAVGAAMMSSLQQKLPAMFEKVFKNIVLSSFERSSQEMFRQIDESFRRGTMEYMSQLQQQHHNVHESTLQYLLSSVENLQTVVGRSLESSAPTHLQSVVHQEVAALSHQLKNDLTEVFAEVIHKEMQVSRVSQDSQHREEVKEQMQKLILSQNYNSAFELALSTSDLQLVTYLCQQVDSDILFDKSPCPLSQPVLLSLIQQLSVNLEEHLELKLKYLDQSLLALDVDNDVTRNHMVSVIKQLFEHMSSLQEKIQLDPGSINPTTIKQVKRLLMVSQHMCISRSN